MLSGDYKRSDLFHLILFSSSSVFLLLFYRFCRRHRWRCSPGCCLCHCAILMATATCFLRSLCADFHSFSGFLSFRCIDFHSIQQNSIQQKISKKKEQNTTLHITVIEDQYLKKNTSFSISTVD